MTLQHPQLFNYPVPIWFIAYKGTTFFFYLMRFAQKLTKISLKIKQLPTSGIYSVVFPFLPIKKRKRI